MQDSDVDDAEGSNDDDDHHSWVSVDNEEMINDEEWATVDYMDGCSDAPAGAHDLSAFTATPDTMSECSMRTAVGPRTTTAAIPIPGTGTHSVTTRSSGITGLYDNLNANITLTENEPYALYPAASCASVVSRTSGATQPKPEIYGHLTSEELEDVFGDVHDHPNDVIVDGMRKLNDKYIALRKVGEVCWHKLELLLLPNTVRLLPGTRQSEKDK